MSIEKKIANQTTRSFSRHGLLKRARLEKRYRNRAAPPRGRAHRVPRRGRVNSTHPAWYDTTMNNNTLKVLPYGTKVRLTNVDMYGFCGRDHHPRPEDVGFLGIIVGNIVDLYDANEAGEYVSFKQNVPGGVELHNDLDGEHAFVCYTVVDPSGRRRDLMHFEIEKIDNVDEVADAN